MRAFVALIAMLAAAPAWCSDPFPHIEAENVPGKKIVLPDDAKGHATVLVIGFTHASQNQTKAWAAELRPSFEMYSLAVLEDVPRLVRGMAVGGIKGGVPQNQRDHFLLVFHGEKELKAAAGFEKPDDAYIVLLDRDGAINWSFHGPFSENARDELKSHVAALATP